MLRKRYDLKIGDPLYDFYSDPLEFLGEKAEKIYIVTGRIDENSGKNYEKYTVYDMIFELDKSKSNHNAFINTAMGMVLACNPKNPEHKRSISCNVSDSRDGVNHFWLLRRKK